VPHDIDCFRESQRYTVKKLPRVDSIRKHHGRDNYLALRIIVDEVDGFVVVSWGAKTVIHADTAEFVGGRGLETPDIYIDSKYEVESCTMDAYFAPSVQECE
jgi:hypothetical protein